MWMSYWASSANVKKFGPPAGSSNGIQLAMNVVVSGLSGLTKAYRSVLSYCGVPEISGASLRLEAPAGRGCRVVAPAAASPPAASATQIRVASPLRPAAVLEIGVNPSVLLADLPLTQRN